jgi:hypothetical protein
MKTRTILTTIATIAARAIVGGAIGYAVGTAIDRIRTNLALKKSIEDAANDPRVRRVHIDRINIDRVPVERTPVDFDDEAEAPLGTFHVCPIRVGHSLHSGSYFDCASFIHEYDLGFDNYVILSDHEYCDRLLEEEVETIDEMPDYADPDELPSFSEILRNTRYVVQDCVTGCADMCNTNKHAALFYCRCHEYCNNFVVVDCELDKVYQGNYSSCCCYADERERECSYDNFDPELDVLELDIYMKQFC